MTTRQRIAASCIAIAAVGVVVTADLAGYVALALNVAVAVLGVSVLSIEAARRIAKDWQHAKARRHARGAAGQG